MCILLLFCIVLSLSYCGDNNTKNNANNDNANFSYEEVADENYISDDLPSKNWGGKEFRILARGTCKSHMQEVWVESETGDVIDDAVYRRNMTLEDRFNIVIVPTFISESEISEDQINRVLEISVAAGEDAYDYAILHEMFGAQSAMKGLCLNWYSLPYLNFEKPWWASWLIKDYEVAGKSYLAMNDMGIDGIVFTACFYFNKDLVHQYSLENLYDLVRDRKWTLDKFAEYIKDFGADLNGDGILDENDLYGFTGIGGRNFEFMYASDQTVTQRDEDGIPQLAINTEKMFTIFEKCKDIFTSKDTFFDDVASVPVFRESRALLSTGNLNYALTSLRNMEIDFGIIPYPKYDEKQTDYFTHQDPHGPIMVVPMTITDFEFVGMMIEAIAAEGYRTVRPAIYDVALKIKQARDEDSAEMIDIILDGRRSDFGYPYDGWGFAFTLDFLARGNINNFASFYAQNSARAEKSYATAVELILELEY